MDRRQSTRSRLFGLRSRPDGGLRFHLELAGAGLLVGDVSARVEDVQTGFLGRGRLLGDGIVHLQAGERLGATNDGSRLLRLGGSRRIEGIEQTGAAWGSLTLLGRECRRRR